jgi:hypothetical protein
MTHEEYRKAITLSGHPLLCSTGIVNEYRRSELQGLLGSQKEDSWNRAKHIHECCASKQSWRHRVSCPRLTDDGMTFATQQSDLVLSIKKRKLQGKTSADIANDLAVPLAEVNKYWNA